MAAIYDAVVAYFEKRGTTVVAISDVALSAPVAGVNGAWTVFATVREAESQLLLHSVLPENVDVDRRAELVLFITRANFGLVIGNFEIDLDDGELRFKTSIDVEGDELTDALIDNLLLANVTMMDRYLPGIRAVVNGTAAGWALAAIERD